MFYKIFVVFLRVIAYNIVNRNNVSIGLVVRPRSINGGEVPRFFHIICCEVIPLKELSIFIDESGGVVSAVRFQALALPYFANLWIPTGSHPGI